MVILHYLNEENYKKAIEHLKQLKPNQVLDFIYKYCHILMRHEPGKFFMYYSLKLRCSTYLQRL